MYKLVILPLLFAAASADLLGGGGGGGAVGLVANVAQAALPVAAEVAKNYRPPQQRAAEAAVPVAASILSHLANQRNGDPAPNNNAAPYVAAVPQGVTYYRAAPYTGPYTVTYTGQYPYGGYVN